MPGSWSYAVNCILLHPICVLPICHPKNTQSDGLFVSFLKKAVGFFRTVVTGKFQSRAAFLVLSSGEGNAGRVEMQLIHDYQSLVETATPGPKPWSASPRINPFLSYTNIGTDFGFLGPSMDAISWDPGSICVGFGVQEWGGVWHSLAGRATDTDLFDFQRPFPAIIEPRFQPTVTHLELQVRGRGIFAVEVKAPDQLVLWQRRWNLAEDKLHVLSSGLDNTPPGKMVNWVAESGSQLCVDHVGMRVTMPDMADDLEMLLRCYAKFARCYSPSTGFLKDRAHLDQGAFDNTPATGLFCLATAAAADLGFVSEKSASALLRRTAGLMAAVPARAGILPHFLKSTPTGHRIHQGTEFSMVDTAICYQAMLLAAEMLRDGPVAGQLVGAMKRIDFAQLRDPQGRVHHGLWESGELIPSVWEDWGGETALVLIQQRLGMEPDLTPAMKRDAAVFRDCGFIPEIAALLYPHFDRAERDALTGQNWPGVRRGLYDRQKAYFIGNPASRVPASVFGLSAGEGRFGDTYLVSGTALPEQRTIHPHYLFLSWASAPSPGSVFETFDTMRKSGFFPPWGCVENIDAFTGGSLPMQGALNASFEFLGAYHAYKAHYGEINGIYAAALRQRDLVEALKVFYP